MGGRLSMDSFMESSVSLHHNEIEAALGLTLPQVYKEALEAVSTDCNGWRDPYGPFVETDVGTLIDWNRRIRETPSKFVKTPRKLSRSWPKDLVVCFASERLLCFFDSSEADPQIQFALSGELQEFDPFRTPRHYSNFRQMTRYCLWKYRNQISWETKNQFQEAQRAEARANKSGEDPSLVCPDLIEEGKRLARPSLVLRERGDAYAAILGGTGVVPISLPGEWDHRFSFSCDHLPINPRKLHGVVSVYWQDDYLQSHAAINDPGAALPEDSDGTKLYGTPFDCLPSVGVVLANGGAAVRRWTRAIGEWIGDLDVFECQENVARYIEAFQANHPHWADPSCRMMLGGWGAGFPESDWLRRMSHTLLASQLRDEPFLEIYDTGTELQADEHVT